MYAEMASKEGAPKKDTRLLRTKKKERTRNNIITEAAKLFSKRPYDDVLLEDIAEAAFISRQTLYNYFNNKEDVFFAAGNQIYKEENEKMAEVVSSDAPGKEQIIHLCEKKFRDSTENPVLLKIIREFWDRFNSRDASSAEVYSEIIEKIGASQLQELIEKPDLLEEFDLEKYFEEPNFIELYIQFLRNGGMWLKAIRKGKLDDSIKNDMEDMQIMQFINILTDGVIHETMRRQSALDRIGMKRETFESNTIKLVVVFLDDRANR